MKLSSNGFADNQRIPSEYAFCAPDPKAHVTLYALDVSRCGVTGIFKGADVLAAIKGHTLAQAKLTGVYSLNPDVKV